MPIFTDSIGNVFLGDCLWGNHSLAYSTVNYLQANSLFTLSNDLSSLLSSAGLNFSNVVAQSDITDALNINNVTNTTITPTKGTLFPYAFDWFKFKFNGSNNFIIFRRCSGSTNDPMLQFRNLDDNANIGQLSLLNDNTTFPRAYILMHYNNGGDFNSVPVSAFGVASSNSVGIGICKHIVSDTSLTSNPDKIAQIVFTYAGLLQDINTNGGGYYSNNILNRHIFMGCTLSNYVNSAVSIGSAGTRLHYTAFAHYSPQNTFRYTLMSGRAHYDIVCADGQNPTENWATDVYVFDNDTTNNRFPCMGRVPNLLFGQGTYTLLKPVKIQGTTKPDNGFNRWLPIGYWGDKTVLMRCYSSVDI